jgi:hypothetical protein
MHYRQEKAETSWHGNEITHKDNPAELWRSLMDAGGMFMPNTVGVLLLFALVFLAAILWATHGHTADTDGMGDVTGHPGKDV